MTLSKFRFASDPRVRLGWQFGRASEFIHESHCARGYIRFRLHDLSV